MRALIIVGCIFGWLAIGFISLVVYLCVTAHGRPKSSVWRELYDMLDETPSRLPLLILLGPMSMIAIIIVFILEGLVDKMWDFRCSLKDYAKRKMEE